MTNDSNQAAAPSRAVPGADRAPNFRVWSEESDFGPTYWFWFDDHCSEPMGPFASHAEAMMDFRDCRPSSSDTGASR